jgi:hypothetical protein
MRFVFVDSIDEVLSQALEPIRAAEEKVAAGRPAAVASAT